MSARDLTDNYTALRRHYQFTNWYIEILPTGEVTSAGIPPCILQEVRDGKVIRRTRQPRSFLECEKMLQERAFHMSREAGGESAPPALIADKLEWK